MPSSDDIAKQIEILAAHRSTLAEFLRQQALFGIAYAPPGIANGIRASRAAILNIKVTLQAAARGWAAQISDGDDGVSSVSPPASASGAGSLRYPSLAALQVAHNDLLKRQRGAGDAPEFLAEIGAFMCEGAATGALLAETDDRRAAQTLLDYWAARLYRVGEEPPDSTLAEFDPLLAPELPDELCPYLGLDAFREADHDKFFGRRELIARLVERLADHRLLAVVGPSGGGKSSLVRAGLIPALKAGALPGSQDWRYLSPIVPGSDPVANLARVLPDKEARRQGDKESDLSDLPVSLSPCLLVVDQFEELFTLCDDDQARQAFVAKLRDLIDTPGAEHRLILTMRSDFETFVARAPDLQARFEESRVQVTPLSAAELREAIERPAEAVGLKFESGVIDLLLQDILGEPAGLPLLQFTLLKWSGPARGWRSPAAASGATSCIAAAKTPAGSTACWRSWSRRGWCA